MDREQLEKQFKNMEIDKNLIDKLYPLFENKLLQRETSNELPLGHRAFLREMNDILAYHFKLEIPDVYLHSSFSSDLNFSAHYDFENMTINISATSSIDPFMPTILSLFHEFRHHKQNCEMLGISKGIYSTEKLNLLKENMITRDSKGTSNYISGNDIDNNIIHFTQPIEKDANDFGFSLTFALMDEFEKKHGKNAIIEEYKKSEFERYPITKININHQKNNEAIFKIWDFRKKINNQIIEKKEHLNNLDSLNKKEIEDFFDVLVWENMNEQERVDVLEQYDKHLAVVQNREPYSNIKEVVYKKDPHHIKLKNNPIEDLEVYFEYSFEKWVDNTIKNERETQPKLVQELEITKDDDAVEINKKNFKKRALKEKYVHSSIKKMSSNFFSNINESNKLDPRIVEYKKEMNNIYNKTLSNNDYEARLKILELTNPKQTTNKTKKTQPKLRRL